MYLSQAHGRIVAREMEGAKQGCDFTHKLELFVKHILAAGFDQKRFYRLLA
jgi:hypothetical protein